MCPPTGRGLGAHSYDSPDTLGRQPGRDVLRGWMQSSLECARGSEELLRGTDS